MRALQRLNPQWLPFADAATDELPLGRLLRLGLFQVSVGMALTLQAGTLNRIVIVEFGAPAAPLALLVALPVLVAPFRALIGYRSDLHRSVLGWRRVPYLLTGTMLQFGGLAIMPFGLILLQGDTEGSTFWGWSGSALAFLALGAGAHTTQTAGLALATDLATPASRHRVVALLYLMLLLGMVASALGFSVMLQPFSNTRLVQVVQTAAVLTAALNLCALWKQERRERRWAEEPASRSSFAESWRAFIARGHAARLLVATAFGTAGFGMQDILLEPYGGQVLRLGVAETTRLTAFTACGALVAFAIAARWLGGGGDPARLAAAGALGGIFALTAVIFASPLGSALLFQAGSGLIGFGAGLFSVGTLTAAMSLEGNAGNGLALGAWGAVQATAAGVAIAGGGVLRDFIGGLAASGVLGPALTHPSIGYSAVYHLEVVILFVALAAVGPLASPVTRTAPAPARFGLAGLPG